MSRTYHTETEWTHVQRKKSGNDNCQSYGSGRGQSYGDRQTYGGGRNQTYGSDRNQSYGSGRGQSYGGGRGQSYGSSHGQSYGDRQTYGSGRGYRVSDHNSRGGFHKKELKSTEENAKISKDNAKEEDIVKETESKKFKGFLLRRMAKLLGYENFDQKIRFDQIPCKTIKEHLETICKEYREQNKDKTKQKLKEQGGGELLCSFRNQKLIYQSALSTLLSAIFAMLFYAAEPVKTVENLAYFAKEMRNGNKEVISVRGFNILHSAVWPRSSDMPKDPKKTQLYVESIKKLIEVFDIDPLARNKYGETAVISYRAACEGGKAPYIKELDTLLSTLKKEILITSTDIKELLNKLSEKNFKKCANMIKSSLCIACESIVKEFVEFLFSTNRGSKKNGVFEYISDFLRIVKDSIECAISNDKYTPLLETQFGPKSKINRQNGFAFFVSSCAIYIVHILPEKRKKLESLPETEQATINLEAAGAMVGEAAFYAGSDLFINFIKKMLSIKDEEEWNEYGANQVMVAVCHILHKLTKEGENGKKIVLKFLTPTLLKAICRKCTYSYQKISIENCVKDFHGKHINFADIPNVFIKHYGKYIDQTQKSSIKNKTQVKSENENKTKFQTPSPHKKQNTETNNKKYEHLTYAPKRPQRLETNETSKTNETNETNEKNETNENQEKKSVRKKIDFEQDRETKETKEIKETKDTKDDIFDEKTDGIEIDVFTGIINTNDTCDYSPIWLKQMKAKDIESIKKQQVSFEKNDSDSYEWNNTEIDNWTYGMEKKKNPEFINGIIFFATSECVTPLTSTEHAELVRLLKSNKLDKDDKLMNHYKLVKLFKRVLDDVYTETHVMNTCKKLCDAINIEEDGSFRSLWEQGFETFKLFASLYKLNVNK
jgi:hypothetical protein